MGRRELRYLAVLILSVAVLTGCHSAPAPATTQLDSAKLPPGVKFGYRPPK